MTSTTSTYHPQGRYRVLQARYRELYQRIQPGTSLPGAPHPGDILYWVGCIGAVGAVLFFAIR
jgi:hypothetical protein